MDDFETKKYFGCEGKKIENFKEINNKYFC